MKTDQELTKDYAENLSKTRQPDKPTLLDKLTQLDTGEPTRIKLGDTNLPLENTLKQTFKDL